MRLLAAVATLTIVVTAPLSAELSRPAARKPAPAFALPDEHQSRRQLSTFKGKVVLLDFWATWCAGCKVEIPWFVEFQKKYRPQGLSAIGVAMDDEGWKTVAPYLAEHPIGYTIVAGDAAVAERYGVAALPVTVLIDRRGRWPRHMSGSSRKTPSSASYDCCSPKMAVTDPSRSSSSGNDGGDPAGPQGRHRCAGQTRQRDRARS